MADRLADVHGAEAAGWQRAPDQTSACTPQATARFGTRLASHFSRLDVTTWLTAPSTGMKPASWRLASTSIYQAPTAPAEARPYRRALIVWTRPTTRSAISAQQWSPGGSLMATFTDLLPSSDPVTKMWVPDSEGGCPCWVRGCRTSPCERVFNRLAERGAPSSKATSGHWRLVLDAESDPR